MTSDSVSTPQEIDIVEAESEKKQAINLKFRAVVRAFLAQERLHETLNMFQAEWYRLEATESLDQAGKAHFHGFCACHFQQPCGGCCHFHNASLRAGAPHAAGGAHRDGHCPAADQNPKGHPG